MHLIDRFTRKIGHLVFRLLHRERPFPPPNPTPRVPRGNPPWDPEGKTPPTVGIDRVPLVSDDDGTDPDE
jgi:hypothetical protein